MPRVPVAEAQVGLQPLARTNFAPVATPAAFGAQRGRALQGAGAALGRAGDALAVNALRFQERQDAEQVRQAYVDFDRRVRAYLHDPEQGLYSRQGAAARGVTTDALKRLDELELEAAANLRRPQQQEHFAARAAGLKSGHLDSLARYEQTEFRKVEDETTKAVLASSVEGGIGAFRSETLRNEYMAQGNYELERMARLHGWTPEQLAIERTKYHTVFHKGVVERMLVDDPSGARAYYEKHQGDINGATRTELEASLKEGVTRERARAETERIVAAGGGLDAQLKAARAIDDAHLSDEVVRRVKERFNEGEALRARAERDAKDSAWRTVIESRDMDAVPPHILSKLDGYTIMSMQNYIDKQGDPDTDQTAYYELSTLAGRDPKGFVDVNMLDYRAKLSNSDWQYMANLQRTTQAALKGAETEAAEVKRVATVQQQIDAAMNKLGLPGGEKGAERRGAFAQQARQLIDQAAAEQGRNLTIEEVDGILATMSLKGEVRSGRWFLPDRDAAFFEVQGTPDAAAFVAVPYDELTAEQRQLASDALRARGLPVTEEAVERLHTQLVTRGR